MNPQNPQNPPKTCTLNPKPQVDENPKPQVDETSSLATVLDAGFWTC